MNKDIEGIEKQKKDMRKYYLIIRKNVEYKKFKSEKIANKIIKNEVYKNANVVALYKNLKYEVQTTELIRHSINIGKTVALPKVEKDELIFYKIDSLNSSKFIKSEFGIDEPIKNKNNIIEKKYIDLVIVPGICFDKFNNRLGYGKGYYDRFLKNSNLNTIAICFDEQILEKERIPCTKNDIKIQQIITDKNIYHI